MIEVFMGDPGKKPDMLVDKHRKSECLEREISDCILKHVQSGISYGEMFRALANVQRRWSGYLVEDEYAEQSRK